MKNLFELIKREKIIQYLYIYWIFIVILFLIFNGILIIIWPDRIFGRIDDLNILIMLISNIFILIYIFIITHLIHTKEFTSKNSIKEIILLVLYINLYFVFLSLTIIIVSAMNTGIFIDSFFEFNRILYNIFYAILAFALYKLFRIFFLNRTLFPGGFYDSSPLFIGITIVHGALAPLAVMAQIVNVG